MQDNIDTSELKNFLGLSQENVNPNVDTSELRAFLGMEVPKEEAKKQNGGLLHYLKGLQQESDALRESFTGGVETIAHGIMQPIFESQWGESFKGRGNETLANLSRNYKNERIAKENLASEINPVGSKIYSGLGMLGGSLPVIGAYEALAAASTPAVAGAASPLSNPFVSNPVIGAALGGSQYVDGNDWMHRAVNAGIGGVLGAVFPAAVATGNYLGDAINPSMQTIAKRIMGPAVPEEVLATQAAGRNIGINLRPDEAANNAGVVTNAARFGKSDATNLAINKNMKSRYAEDIAAVENGLNNLSSNPDKFVKQSAQQQIKDAAITAIKNEQKILSNKVQPLYDAADHEIVPKNTIKRLMKADGNIEAAIIQAQKDPTYRAEMAGYAPNSIKVLNKAKIIIDGRIEAAKGTSVQKGNKDLVRVLTDSKNRLIEATDALSPTYNLARKTYQNNAGALNDLEQGPVGRIADTRKIRVDKLSTDIFNMSERQIDQLRKNLRPLNPEAWDANVRTYIEEQMKNTSGSGADLYKTVLKNKSKYNKLIIATKDTPGITSWLSNSKTAFKDVSNPITAKTARGYANTGVDQPRLGDAQLNWKQRLQETLGGKLDERGTAFLTNPNWEDIYLSSLKQLPITHRNQAFSGALTPISTNALVSLLNQPRE